MRPVLLTALSALAWSQCLAGAVGQVKLPTVAEAQTISQKTGRPIFAVAGRET